MPHHNGPSGTYVVDPTQSRIGFLVRQCGVATVRGSFSDLTGSGYLNAEEPARSHLELTILAASIDTGNARRDAHLRSAFVGNKVRVTFDATAVRAAND